MRAQPKIKGLDRILMSWDPSHKYNEITESINDPLEVFKRAVGTTLKNIEDGNIPLQKAEFGRTLDLLWLAQGIVEDLLVHLVNGKPGINNWLRSINKAQEETLELKELPAPKLRSEWRSRVIKHKNFLEEEAICKDLKVSTIKEAKKVLARDFKTIITEEGYQKVVKKGKNEKYPY
jgi:hypothetical protein